MVFSAWPKAEDCDAEVVLAKPFLTRMAKAATTGNNSGSTNNNRFVLKRCWGSDGKSARAPLPQGHLLVLSFLASTKSSANNFWDLLPQAPF